MPRGRTSSHLPGSTLDYCCQSRGGGEATGLEESSARAPSEGANGQQKPDIRPSYFPQGLGAGAGGAGSGGTACVRRPLRMRVAARAPLREARLGPQGPRR